MAGEEARRRKRRGTHPPPRLHCFGRSHPNPTLTTAFLLHNAVRAGPIFEGSIAGDISWHQLPRCEPVWRARVPAACACLCFPVSRRAAGSPRGRKLRWPAGVCAIADRTKCPGKAHRHDGAGHPDGSYSGRHTMRWSAPSPRATMLCARARTLVVHTRLLAR